LISSLLLVGLTAEEPIQSHYSERSLTLNSPFVKLVYSSSRLVTLFIPFFQINRPQELLRDSVAERLLRADSVVDFLPLA